MAFVASNSYLNAAQTLLNTSLLIPGMGHLLVKLVKSPTTFTRDSDSSTFDEADFNGYAAGSVSALGATHLDSKLQWLSLVPEQIFTPTDSLVPNTIYGYWMETSGGLYVGGESFPNPVLLDSPLKTLNFVPGVATATFQFQTPVLP
jgi:hypothetical protein